LLGLPGNPGQHRFVHREAARKNRYSLGDSALVCRAAKVEVL